ncbi:MAG TPA: glycosyltransferase [Planctomycetaceae bacterium]|nr:glycosyltransferase [Planctomycetaceae bacterium]
MLDHGKQNLLGIRLDAVDYEAAVAKIIAAACEQVPYCVSALAVHGVMTGALDRKHTFRLNQLDLVVPDGQPVRWGLNLLHRTQLADRVYGPTLTLKTCEAAANLGLPVFLFGSDASTLDRLSQSLASKFPRLQVAGVLPSRFARIEESECEEIARKIRSSGARIVLAGLGCPRQEIWAFENRERIGLPILAVGAAFAFHAGELSQAPEWMQQRGLEWLYRLGCEPARLWKRYLLLNPLYLTLLGLQATRLFSLRPERGIEPGELLNYG